MNLFPYDSRFDFMRLHWVSLAIAVVLLVIALGAIGVRGFNFALDFTGGSVTELQFQKPVDIEQIRERLEQAGYQSPVVQPLGSGNDVLIRMQPREGQQNVQLTGGAVLQAVQPADNPGRVVSSDFVGPQVGKDLTYNGIVAAVFVLVGFLVYITFRFEWKFAVTASATTLFDTLVTVGWFALSGHEFELTVLAGVLSVMGYSINDKIVVFDRVRENFRNLQRVEPAAVLNRSINQTLSRTVIVSFVAFLTVLALYIYGGASLKGMAESQMIGIVIGTLSSIFVACPLLTLGFLKVSRQDLLPRAKDTAELARRP